MDKVTFIQNTNPVSSEVTEHALIENADGSFNSMLKSTYEAQQVEHLTEIIPEAAQSTPIATDEPATKS